MTIKTKNSALPRATRRERREYEAFIENQCEIYKEVIPRIELLKIGDEAVERLQSAPQFAMNELLLVHEVDRVIMRRLSLPNFKEWREANSIKSQRTSALLDASGQPIDPYSAPGPVLLTVKEINEHVLSELRKNPELLYQLSPRKFEYLVAELLARDGWAVEVTPCSKDGGKDVVAKMHTSAGSFLIYVECKRYSAERPVGVNLVRELLGVVHVDRATAGLLVTTSTFSRGAMRLQESTPHRITLKAYHELVDWLTKSVPTNNI